MKSRALQIIALIMIVATVFSALVACKPVVDSGESDIAESNSDTISATDGKNNQSGESDSNTTDGKATTPAIKTLTNTLSPQI